MGCEVFVVQSEAILVVIGLRMGGMASIVMSSMTGIWGAHFLFHSSVRSNPYEVPNLYLQTEYPSRCLRGEYRQTACD